jgi:hypothetical protein
MMFGTFAYLDPVFHGVYRGRQVHPGELVLVAVLILGRGCFNQPGFSAQGDKAYPH